MKPLADLEFSSPRESKISSLLSWNRKTLFSSPICTAFLAPKHSHRYCLPKGCLVLICWWMQWHSELALCQAIELTQPSLPLGNSRSQSAKEMWDHRGGRHENEQVTKHSSFNKWSTVNPVLVHHQIISLVNTEFRIASTHKKEKQIIYVIPYVSIQLNTNKC